MSSDRDRHSPLERKGALPRLRRSYLAVLFLGACLLIPAGILSLPRPASSPPEPVVASTVPAKIRFSLDGIGADGLRGPADGKVSVSYEFCIPKDDATIRKVREIDPSVSCSAGSRGRVGCTDQQVLCIGNTGQPRWREILFDLASQSFVTEIRECYFE